MVHWIHCWLKTSYRVVKTTMYQFWHRHRTSVLGANLDDMAGPERLDYEVEDIADGPAVGHSNRLEFGLDPKNQWQPK